MWKLYVSKMKSSLTVLSEVQAALKSVMMIQNPDAGGL